MRTRLLEERVTRQVEAVLDEKRGHVFFSGGKEGRKEEEDSPKCHNTLWSQMKSQALLGHSSRTGGIRLGSYLLAGGPVFSVGPRHVLRMRHEELRPLRAQGSPRGRRGSLLFLISLIGIFF